MRRILIGLTALLVVGITATAALAGNVHFNPGTGPFFTDNGLTLTESGTVYGLGNGDLRATIVATVNVTATCTNPSGKQKPPGHNPASVSVSGSSIIPGSEVDNGHGFFSVTTAVPFPPSGIVPSTDPQFSCPNSSWTEQVTGVAFVTVTLTLLQDQDGNGTFETNVTPTAADFCTFSPPTSNGSVPTSQYTCS